MMRTILALSMLLVAFSLTACAPAAPTTPTPTARFGEQVTLVIGQTAAYDSELSVKFLDVTEDSRCPTGVTCIWAGQVSCSLEVTTPGKTEGVTLTQPGLTDAADGRPVGAYTFRFDVEPYPEAGKDIQKTAYRLLLTVTKQGG